MSTAAQRKLIMELNSLLDKTVIVVTTDGRVFEGTLSGFDHPTLNLSLVNVKVGNEFYPKVIIKGDVVAEIMSKEEPIFKIEEFAKILEEYFPNMVKVYGEAGVITVSDRIRITEKGVEGTGPIADRIRRIFNEYIEERKKKLGKE